jgi:hypothetical protein
VRVVEMLAALSFFSLLPARDALDATRHVVTYSTAIEAPSVPVNFSAEPVIIRKRNV